LKRLFQRRWIIVYAASCSSRFWVNQSIVFLKSKL
jgi:hypothetical protein